MALRSLMCLFSLSEGVKAEAALPPPPRELPVLQVIKAVVLRGMLTGSAC